MKISKMVVILHYQHKNYMDYIFDLVKTMHRNFGILLMLFILILLIKVLADFYTKNENLSLTQKISRYVIFTAHIQLFMGLAFLILNPIYFLIITQKIGNTSVIYIEHIISNIVGITLITIFSKKLKKSKNISSGLLILLIFSILSFSRVTPLIIQLFNR